MRVEQLLVGHMLNFSYVVWSDQKVAFVVDPSFGAEPILRRLGELGLRLRYVLSTHHHFDHNEHNERLASATGAEIVAHASSPIRKDVAVGDGDVVEAPGLALRVIHTPGHTVDSVCYYSPGMVFTGDTLFVGSCGRVDLPGGDPAEMYRSLYVRLGSLPEETVVYPGHHYGDVPFSTIGREKKTNVFLMARTPEEFLELVAQP